MTERELDLTAGAETTGLSDGLLENRENLRENLQTPPAVVVPCLNDSVITEDRSLVPLAGENHDLREE